MHCWPLAHEPAVHWTWQSPAVHSSFDGQSESPRHGVGPKLFGFGTFGGFLSTTLGGSCVGFLGAQKFGLPATQVESAAQSESEWHPGQQPMVVQICPPPQSLLVMQGVWLLGSVGPPPTLPGG